MSSYNRTTPVAVAVAAALLAASTTVTAQEDQPSQEVIVTGSRIARPNLESSVPITTVTGDELFQTGTTSVGDLLNDLPAFRVIEGSPTTCAGGFSLRGRGTSSESR